MDVDVTADDGGAPDVVDTGDVVVVPSAGSGPSDEVLRQLADHGERLALVEARVNELGAATVEAQITADIAEGTAEAALSEVEAVAAETEEAVATLAEEADAATAEVVDQVEDIAPGREHPWFATRKVLNRGD